MTTAVYSHARPLRVAYLVEERDDWSRLFDGIVAECYGRWGGTYTLIAPVDAGTLAAGYFDWVRAEDPDIIYACCDLEDVLLRELDRAISPGWFLRHKFSEHIHDPRPQLPFTAVSSLSLLPRRHRAASAFGRTPHLSLVGRYPEWKDDGFLADNFGTPYDSNHHFPWSNAARQFATPLLLTPGNLDRRVHRDPRDAEIADSKELLGQMRDHVDITTLAELASLSARPRLIGPHKWQQTLNLVVGDSFVDRIAFWNSRLLVDRETPGEHISAIRLPVATLEDPEFIDAFCQFVRRASWRLAGSLNAGPGYLTVRSHSVPPERMEKLAETLRQDARCQHVLVESLSDASDCTPAATMREVPIFTRRASERRVVHRDAPRLEIAEPVHFSESPSLTTTLDGGAWVIDQEIERHHNLAHALNDQHWWRLPPRKGIASAFYPSAPARITREGRVAVLARRRGNNFPELYPAPTQRDGLLLQLPEDEEVFRRILHGRANLGGDDLRSSVTISPAYEDSRPSDKGRYLKGVLGLFGSLNAAVEIFSSPFWYRRFAQMGAPALLGEENRIGCIVTKLQKKITLEAIGTVENTTAWERLAKLVISESREERFPQRTLSYSVLRKAWDSELRASLRGETLSTAETEEAIAYGMKSLTRSIESLCERGVLAQGHTWSCRKCSHRNWVSIENIRSRLACLVCGRKRAVPAEMDWTFLLNEFLGAALNEHGTLPLILTLGSLANGASQIAGAYDSFFFAPPSELFTTRSEPAAKPNAEVDLVCASDGRIIVAEVKTSENLIKPTDLQRLAAFAKAWHADEMVIACLGRRTPNLTQLQAELASLRYRDECKVVILPLLDGIDEREFRLPVL